MIFEVAVSQTYKSVLEAARHWLVRSSGATKLVVVVKISEGELAVPEDVGNGDSNDKPVSNSSLEKHDSEFCRQSGYDDFHTNCDQSECVGPITAFMEFHRYDRASGAMYHDREFVGF